jgi:hypothetical protein
MLFPDPNGTYNNQIQFRFIINIHMSSRYPYTVSFGKVICIAGCFD